jgi:uncharacterized protein
MRLFFDTNVLVSAFAARGLCADLLRLALTHHTLLTGEVVIAELRDVLDRKLRLPPDRIEAIEAFLGELPVVPRPGQTLGLGLVDADDEWVVASAVLAQADSLISGDQGLLACSAPPLPMLSPRQCWEQRPAAGDGNPCR